MSESEGLARLTERLADERLLPDPAIELVAGDELRSFGWLRGLRETAPMLELRKKTGNIVAVGYGWIERIEYEPSEGIYLDIGDQRILIRGRNLNAEIRPGVRLFEGLTRHRIPWIREIEAVHAMEADPHACIVESINW